MKRKIIFPLFEKINIPSIFDFILYSLFIILFLMTSSESLQSIENLQQK